MYMREYLCFGFCRVVYAGRVLPNSISMCLLVTDLKDLYIVVYKMDFEAVGTYQAGYVHYIPISPRTL